MARSAAPQTNPSSFLGILIHVICLNISLPFSNMWTVQLGQPEPWTVAMGTSLMLTKRYRDGPWENPTIKSLVFCLNKDCGEEDAICHKAGAGVVGHMLW